MNLMVGDDACVLSIFIKRGMMADRQSYQDVFRIQARVARGTRIIVVLLRELRGRGAWMTELLVFEVQSTVSVEPTSYARKFEMKDTIA